MGDSTGPVGEGLGEDDVEAVEEVLGSLGDRQGAEWEAQQDTGLRR